MKNILTHISLLGFDTRVLKAFEIFFSTKCDDVFFLQKHVQKSDIALIDFDTVHSRKKLDELKSKNSKLIIFGLSLIEQQLDTPNVFFLRKPVNYLSLKKELLTARKALISGEPLIRKKSTSQPALFSRPTSTRFDSTFSKKTAQPNNTSARKPSKSRTSHSTSAARTMGKLDESHFVGTSVDVDISNPQQVLKILYSTNNRIQKIVTNAVKIAQNSGRPVQVICSGIGIIIDPVTQEAHTTARDSVLRPMCLLEIKQIVSMKKTTYPINGNELFALTGKKGNALTSTSIDAFLWKIALWSSRGRVLNTVDFNTPAYLSEWPNFTRLQNFPQAMRIAAYLIQQPCKLGEIAKQLQIPQRYVFSFFSASQAIGISGISARKIDLTIKNEIIVKKLGPRHFLQKILRRLSYPSIRQKKKEAL